MCDQMIWMWSEKRYEVSCKLGVMEVVVSHDAFTIETVVNYICRLNNWKVLKLCPVPYLPYLDYQPYRAA